MFHVKVPVPDDPEAYIACDGIQEHGDHWILFFNEKEAAAAWGEPVEAEERNWCAAWQAEWRAMAVGTRFFLTPPGYAGPVPEGRFRLEMTPGNVFGGGDHPTTQLCLELLERVPAGGWAVDVGAGTGILTRAARLLGFRAVGCDIDPAAAPFVDFLGSADALRGGAFTVVIANIHVGVLREIRGELTRAGRTLLLSGYLAEQAGEMAELFGAPLVELDREGWCAGLFPG